MEQRAICKSKSKDPKEKKQISNSKHRGRSKSMSKCRITDQIIETRA